MAAFLNIGSNDLTTSVERLFHRELGIPPLIMRIDSPNTCDVLFIRQRLQRLEKGRELPPLHSAHEYAVVAWTREWFGAKSRSG
jgi:hypothetical protein